MAKASSPIASSIRGSVSGTNYTALHRCPLAIRSRNSPVNPATSYQSIVRSSFSAASAYWKTLSLDWKTGWSIYSDALTRQGPFSSYTVPGRQTFIGHISYFLTLIQLGVENYPLRLDPPTRLDRPPLIITGVDFIIGPPLKVRLNFFCPTFLYRRYTSRPTRRLSTTRTKWHGSFDPSRIRSTTRSGSGTWTLTFNDFEYNSTYFIETVLTTRLAPFRLSTPQVTRVLTPPAP
jgi:hypothetical protein